jgi:hypothetical protein
MASNPAFLAEGSAVLAMQETGVIMLLFSPWTMLNLLVLWFVVVAIALIAGCFPWAPK